MLRLKRESFASRIGFLMVSAGCAIGIGNVWRFPTVTGQYGGGVFVLFYLLFLVLMGAPVLTMELAVGRAGHGSAGTAYRALEPKGSKWHLHGWACLIGCCVLMMYYTTVSGWMLAYFFRFVKENRQQQPARCKHRDGQHQADHAKRFQRITQALAHAVYIVFSHILPRVNGAIFLPMQRSCCAPFLTQQPCRTAACWPRYCMAGAAFFPLPTTPRWQIMSR